VFSRVIDQRLNDSMPDPVREAGCQSDRPELTFGAVALESVDLVDAAASVPARVGDALVDVNVAVRALEAVAAPARVLVEAVHAGRAPQARVAGALVDVLLTVNACSSNCGSTSRY
jgi:hypothetical protein